MPQMSIETSIYVDTIIIFIYLCILGATLPQRNAKRSNMVPSWLFAALALHTIIHIATDYINYTQSSVIGLYIMCTAYPISGYFALYYYGKYYVLTGEIPDKAKVHISRFNTVIFVLNLLCTLPLIPSGLFFSVTDDCTYIRGSLFFLSYLFAALELTVLSVLALFLVPNRKKKIVFILYGVLPILFDIIILFFPISSAWVNIATLFSSFLLFIFVYLDDQKTMLENETKLAQYKTAIMLSQIGPHFIYNTLSTISALCTMDPKKAQDLTADFTDYLRSDLNLAKAQNLSTFEAELNHTKKYLDIEKVRFGDKLHIEYDIQETHFMLPSLSLQPIVENAVKHGVTKKQSGGTVRIASERRGNRFAVIVTDDGVGFDAEAFTPQEGHYGLSTAMKRVQMLLGGEVTIESAAGQGTTVTILVKAAEGVKKQ